MQMSGNGLAVWTVLSHSTPVFSVLRVRWPEIQSESHSCSCTQTPRKKQSTTGPPNQPPLQVCSYWYTLSGLNKALSWYLRRISGSGYSIRNSCFWQLWSRFHTPTSHITDLNYFNVIVSVCFHGFAVLESTERPIFFLGCSGCRVTAARIWWLSPTWGWSLAPHWWGRRRRPWPPWWTSSFRTLWLKLSLKTITRYCYQYPNM